MKNNIVEKIIKKGIAGYFPSFKSNIAYLFHENTKLTPVKAREYGEHIQLLTSIPYYVDRMRLAYKKYYFAEKIKLPPPPEFQQSLSEVIKKRRSIRKFSGLDITLKEISALLFYSYGINGEIPIPKYKTFFQKLRVTPSAGALYPLELYLIIFKSSQLSEGLYHFNVEDFQLEELKKGNFQDEINKICFLEPYIEIKTANACILITAIFERTLLKYQDRGYRFILIEAGHTAQNISLTATALGMGSVCIGGFLDDKLNELLEIETQNESIIYPIILGKVDYGKSNIGDQESF
jgi:SagB-type dehydrogenase family enzyme